MTVLWIVCLNNHRPYLSLKTTLVLGSQTPFISLLMATAWYELQCYQKLGNWSWDLVKKRDHQRVVNSTTGCAGSLMLPQNLRRRFKSYLNIDVSKANLCCEMEIRMPAGRYNAVSAYATLFTTFLIELHFVILSDLSLILSFAHQTAWVFKPDFQIGVYSQNEFDHSPHEEFSL